MYFQTPFSTVRNWLALFLPKSGHLPSCPPNVRSTLVSEGEEPGMFCRTTIVGTNRPPSSIVQLYKGACKDPLNGESVREKDKFY